MLIKKKKQNNLNHKNADFIPFLNKSISDFIPFLNKSISDFIPFLIYKCGK